MESQKELPFRTEPERLIFGLNASDRVKRLLLALHWLSQEHGMKLDNGDTMLDPNRDDVVAMMRSCRRTYNAALFDATAVGYVSLEPAQGKRNLYVVHWPLIFEESREATENSAADTHRKPAASHGWGRLHERYPVTCEPKPGDIPDQNPVTSDNKPGDIVRTSPTQIPAENRGGQQPGDVTDFAPHGMEYGNKTHGAYKAGKRSWPKRIERNDLRNPRAVHALYEIALSWGNIDRSEMTQVIFFATSQRVLRAKNPGAAFTSNVKHKRLSLEMCSQADIDWARAALRELRGTPFYSLTASAGMYTVPPSGQRSREEQQAAMRKLEASRR